MGMMKGAPIFRPPFRGIPHRQGSSGMELTVTREPRFRAGRRLYRRRFLRLLIMLCLFYQGIGLAHGQELGVSTNVLYWATGTPNVMLTGSLGGHSSLGVSVGYNPFQYPNRTLSDGTVVNPKLMHWSISPEYRYWLCRPYERFYLGGHALYSRYNISGLSFLDGSDDRFEGWCAGAGVGVGYQWALGLRWGVEVSLGVGYLYFRYDRYVCGACGDRLGRFDRHYFGPTRASVSFVYFIR